MEYKELEKKSHEELVKMLAEERATLYDLRLKLGVNQLRDIAKVKKTRRNIARLITRLNKLDNKPAPKE